MAAHQYWRLTGFLTDSNVLELSQAQLYDGAQLIAQAPTFTVPPTTGAAFPDVLRWDDFSMPGFALVWDLTPPVDSPSLRLGAGSTADNFPKELYCQYSDDGKFWSTNNAPVNIKFPGAGLLTDEPGAAGGEADADFSKVSLLLQNGEMNTQGHAVQLNGGAAQTSSVLHFDLPTLRVLGNHGSFVSIPNSQDFNFGAEDFTIEVWIALGAISSVGGAIMGSWGSSPSTNPNWLLYVGVDRRVTFYIASNPRTGETAPLRSDGEFNLLTLSRKGNTLYLLLDGKLVPVTTYAPAIPYTQSQPVRLGIWDDPVSYLSADYGGIRITKGVARYTAEFTPPTQAFPISGNAAGVVFLPLSSAPPEKRWRTSSLSPEYIVGAPLSDFNIEEFSPQETFMDAYHGGNGRLYGVVEEKHAPTDTPLRREVLLIDEASNVVIRKTWSDALTGAYEFVGIKRGVQYTDLAPEKRIPC